MVYCSVKKRTTENIIEILHDIYGDLYDYSKIVFVDNFTEIELSCSKEHHGTFFATPRNLIERKNGCPFCSGYTMNKELFIQKAQDIHGELYDYSIVNYINGKTKIDIICKIHGIFSIQPTNHTSTGKQGCKKCAHDRFKIDYRNDLDTFLEKSIAMHGYRYDYSKVNYVNNKTDVEIVCPEHGIFMQIPTNHYSLIHGCPECGRIKLSIAKSDTKDSFVEKSKKIHGNKYNYNKVIYKNCATPVEIICAIHGPFMQNPMHHTRGCGCQSCAKTESKWELEMKDYIRSLGFNADKNRQLINPFELDILIEEKKLAFEANGLWWHSEANQSNKQYHLNKTELCEKKGIQLMHIFEDEWMNNSDLVKSMISNKLGKSNRLIFARKCTVKEVSDIDTKLFLDANHLQGKLTILNYNIGLYYNNELVSIMALGKSRYDEKYEWELYRFCSLKYTNVIGGANKLLSYFNKNKNPNNIISYANRRFSIGGIYDKMDFIYQGKTDSLNYWYIHKDEIKRFGRQQFQKHLLKDKLSIFDESLTEVENMKKNNYYRIWDCGNLIYSWHKK